jgi:hypothetical protein
MAFATAPVVFTPLARSQAPESQDEDAASEAAGEYYDVASGHDRTEPDEPAAGAAPVPMTSDETGDLEEFGMAPDVMQSDGTDLATDPAFAEEMDSVATPTQLVYQGYFERQEGLHCGMHALNNVIGERFLTKENMESAVETYVWQQEFEGCPERICDHWSPDGNYSEAALTHALICFENTYTLDVNMPILPLTTMPEEIFSDDILGVIVNKDQGHWVGVKVVENLIWLLDSIRLPQLLSHSEYLDYLLRFDRAFFIRRLPPSR